jgi:pimeloyl-ACP methyl ester carboxylesterase
MPSMGKNTTTTSQDGTTIAFTTMGSGPAIILVGGALEHKSDQLMSALAPLLAKEFTVVSYDRRGRGDSTDTPPYTIDREIEDLESVIRDNGRSAYVFGMSSGGTLGLLAASRLAGIAKLAVYEAPFIPEQLTGSSAADYLAQLKTAVAGDDRGGAVKIFLKRIGMPAVVVAIMRLTPMWRRLKALAPTLIYDAVVVSDGSVPTQLSAVTIPVLLLTGTSDQMQNGAKAALRTLPNAQHQILKGQTHNVKAAALAPSLAKFFRESK